MKCFDSDPDMHVPLKKLQGVRKEKSIVVLERRTCSKKIHSLMLNILMWNIRGIILSKSRLRHLLNKCRPFVVALLEHFLSENK